MYGIKNCDSVKKANKFLQQHKTDFEFIDFRQQPLDATTVQTWVEKLGWEKLLNKRSTTYKNLTEEEKNNINIELILKSPTLIKRPILVTADTIEVGFNEEVYSMLGSKFTS